jgi:hypothetical protein
MKILISFVGTHDPIGEGDKCGPILTIVNEYKPDKIVLYTTDDKTQDMKRHINDTISYLQGDYEIIEKTIPVEDVSDFDNLFCISDFNKEFFYLYKDAEFIINTTSGTQQMISSLILDILANKYNAKFVQTKDPRYGKQGIAEPKFSYFQYHAETEKVRELFSNYDFNGVLQLQPNNQNAILGKKLLNLEIPNGVYKSQPKIARIINAFNVMQIDLLKENFNSFVFRLTPIIFETGFELVKSDNRILNKHNRYMTMIDGKKVPLSFRHILDFYDGDSIITTLMQQLRNIEENLRNKAAHTLQKINRNDFDIPPEQIMKKLKSFIHFVFNKQIIENDWQVLPNLTH